MKFNFKLWRSGCWISEDRVWILERVIEREPLPPECRPREFTTWNIYQGRGDKRLTLEEAFYDRVTGVIYEAPTFAAAKTAIEEGLPQV